MLPPWPLSFITSTHSLRLGRLEASVVGGVLSGIVVELWWKEWWNSLLRVFLHVLLCLHMWICFVLSGHTPSVLLQNPGTVGSTPQLLPIST